MKKATSADKYKFFVKFEINREHFGRGYVHYIVGG